MYLNKKVFIFGIIELLILAQFFSARTVFNSFQIIIELILISFFLYKTVKIIFKKKEYFFFFISFVIISFLSLITSPFNVFLLNFKIYFLAFLSIVYFSKFNYNFRIVNFFMIINALVILLEYFFQFNPLESFSNIYGSTFSSNYTHFRPIGLFLTPHASINLLIIYFVFLAYQKKSLIKTSFLTFIIFIGEVSSLFFAYIVQLLRLKKIKTDLFFLTFIGFIGIILFSTFYLTYFNVNLYNSIISYEWEFLQNFFDYGRIFGIQVILAQILSLETYIQAFTLIPRDFKTITEGFWHFAGNEVMFFQLIQQGGILIFLIYIKMLLKSAKYFSFLILLSLIHYGDIVTPLAVGMFISYNKLIKNE
jgi:hypothetical protein